MADATNKKRYSVVEYVFGDYEAVHEVGERDPEAEYVLVTDRPGLMSRTWEVVVDSSLAELSTFDKCYAVRFNVFKYCHTDICLRIDASIQIHRSTKCLLDEFERNAYDIALMPHPVRDRIPDEYEIWIRERAYPRQQANRCMEAMRMRGYDLNRRGIFQGGFAILRRNEATESLNAKTYEWLRELGMNGEIERLDQTIFSCVMNMEFSHFKVLLVSEQLFHSELMSICYHGTDIENPGPQRNLLKPEVKWVFDRPAKCQYFFLDPEESGELRKMYIEVQRRGRDIWARIRSSTRK